MKSFSYQVQNDLGIHARTAGALAVLATDCKSTIVIDNGKRRENVKRLMAVLGMGVKKGHTVTVIVDGEDEDTTFAKVEAFFNNNL